jgi:hypothetical protein
LVERFAIRLLRKGFFVVGWLACVSVADLATRCSMAADRSAAAVRAARLLRSFDGWTVGSCATDPVSCHAGFWGANSCGAKPCNMKSGGIDFRGSHDVGAGDMGVPDMTSLGAGSCGTGSCGAAAACRLSADGCSGGGSGSASGFTSVVPLFGTARPAIDGRSRFDKQARSNCSQVCLQGLARESAMSALASSGRSTLESSRIGAPTPIRPHNAIKEAAVMKCMREYKAQLPPERPPPRHADLCKNNGAMAGL